MKNLKQQEERLLREIEDEGLMRLVEYHGPDDMCTTVVALVKKDEWYSLPSEKRMMDCSRHGGGHATCSIKDRFNKKLGRLIATGRAFKWYKRNNPEYQERKFKELYLEMKRKEGK